MELIENCNRVGRSCARKGRALIISIHRTGSGSPEPQPRLGVQSSHLPFGLAGPLNIAQLPQAAASAPGVKKRHPLQVLPGSGELSV